MARRIKVVLRIFVVLPFSQYCCEEVVWKLNGSRPTVCVQKRMSLSRHICSRSSSISQILTAQFHSQHLTRHLHCYHVLPVSCRCTRSYSAHTTSETVHTVLPRGGTATVVLKHLVLSADIGLWMIFSHLATFGNHVFRALVLSRVSRRM